ncbi:signal transducer and activator of transcription 2 isoform X2 [Polyodon spathula]|uniref:signal transducer and activator of transcription 2 isoform X2 n=1 Tax=Polyodon spathula TaxID=7913 RepID=UPI001B7F4872|nr:signal transducer and activator of transcription 2 isoform X2 [Polyodon spathula]
MAQWHSLQQLDSAYLQKVDELYIGEDFPMAVRHYLSPWIESQDWEKASRDVSVASILFQNLLENLDIQYSRFGQESEAFLLQHNFRSFKQNFQVQMLQVQQNPMETESQQDIQKKMLELKSKVLDMEHHVNSLEEQQDEFDFKFKTHNLEGHTEQEKREEMKVLQDLLNKLNESRKNLLVSIRNILGIADSLLVSLVKEELVDWRRRQQKACIGAPENVCLNRLEQWFTVNAECLFHLKKILKKLEELCGKLTYEGDPFKMERPALQKRLDQLLTDLLQSAFVVESQPTIPQGKGPLALRTNVQFSVKTRLLVKIPEMNHLMKVTAMIDKDIQQVKGYRRFNILGTNSKALNMAESTSGGMVAEFRHLTLKEQKAGSGGKGSNDGALSVTEELHIISFEALFERHGLSVKLQASTLPVVIISNTSQQQSAWASVLWFNMLCTDPKALSFFASSPVATWPQLSEMLSWQFLSLTKRGLNEEQLRMLAEKLFGRQLSYENCRLSWARFSKENFQNNNFSFWAWIDGILTLVKSYLEDLWNEGYIMGFVSKGKEKSLLKKQQHGTFLLRFSESCKDGAITFSWVDHFSNGKSNVRSVQPFTKNDLSQIPFVEILRNFQILVDENIPENPLKFLYPNIPKDDALWKYYAEKNADGENPYKEYIKTKLIVIFTDKPNDIRSAQSVDTMNSPVGTRDCPGDAVPQGITYAPQNEEVPPVTVASDELLTLSDELLNDPWMSVELPQGDTDLCNIDFSLQALDDDNSVYSTVNDSCSIEDHPFTSEFFCSNPLLTPVTTATTPTHFSGVSHDQPSRLLHF